MNDCIRHLPQIRSPRSPLAPQAELSYEYGFNYPTKSRAGRVLGRVHAALGDHSLSTSAFDASLAVARTGRYLLQVRGEASHHLPTPFSPSLCWFIHCNQECLAVRGRALAGRGAPEGASGHWSEREGRQRVAEVVGRVEAGSREALEAALLSRP